jgi:hypothetical protein
MLKKGIATVLAALGALLTVAIAAGGPLGDLGPARSGAVKTYIAYYDGH